MILIMRINYALLFKTLLTGFVFLAALKTYSQETSGALQGRIVYNGKEPLGGATVTAIHQASGTKYTTTSLVNGQYYLPGLRIGGPYRVQVSYTGMETMVRDSIQILPRGIGPVA